jgi:hypothetical protein
MTVSAVVPAALYTANGTTVQFFWGWQMLPESAIEVRVNGQLVTNYTENVGNILFDTPPANGDIVLIFRRTPIWMPEDYAFARGFKSEKTELSLDRAYMIAQEYEAGYVGAANISAQVQSAGIDVRSERGSDAFLPLWEGSSGSVPPPLSPDPDIIWAGPQLFASITTGGGTTRLTTFFLGDWSSPAPIGVSSYMYQNETSQLFAPWINRVPIALGEFWIRVSSATGDPVVIKTGQGIVKNVGDEFEAKAATIAIDNIGDTPPSVRTATLSVGIAGDNNGVPDGQWVERLIEMRVST